MLNAVKDRIAQLNNRQSKYLYTNEEKVIESQLTKIN